MSSRAFAYVELLALQGDSAARRILQSSTAPVDDPAATIWRLLQLEKNIQTLNEDTIEVLRAFIGLSTSEESLIDKRCFAKMALDMFYYRRIFPYVRDDGTSAPGISLQSFTEIIDMAIELFSTGCSFTEVCSLPLLCENVDRTDAANFTLLLGSGIIENLTKVTERESRIAKIREQLSTYREFLDCGTSKWHQYQEELQEIYESADAWEKFESKVESCGLDQLKLKQVFSSVLEKVWSAANNKAFSVTETFGFNFRELDQVIRYFFKTRRSREILLPLMESFIEILAKTEEEQLLVLHDEKGDSNNAVIWICSTLMNFCSREGCLSPSDLFHCVSRVRILKIKKLSIDRVQSVVQSFNQWKYIQERHEEMYDKFMEMHSKSPVEEIRTLVTVCREIQHEILLSTDN